ncbi:MAG TPA: CDP-2,3-bis-(O-geranylgeranyl)-sn-glycerol synthase [Candidatus Thermoplasmatota archaeon]|nr:CDP-2,3-bis-(O-geranylgeranyl)-sn-glycerol synthase [Candidatus Thermoplasmatota archaeon]
MAGPGTTLVTALWFLLPAYLANMAPVFVGGGAPMDGGRVWRDGRRILGAGKTWRGFLLAPPVAALLYTGLEALARAGWLPFPPLAATPAWTFAFALALGYGALFGDAMESFFKRRLGKERGARWLGFDQLDFVLGAWILAILVSTVVAPVYGGVWFVAAFTPVILLVQLLATPALHLIVNWIGFKIGKKDVPW